MKTSTLFYVIVTIVIGLAIWMVIDAGSQPGLGDIKVEFEEKASYRNENNTGPVQRIYAVWMAEADWDEMKRYGELMPHTKYGNTKVFFFLDKNNTPTKVFPDEPYYDASLAPYCVAIFEKKAMGEEAFRQLDK